MLVVEEVPYVEPPAAFARFGERPCAVLLDSAAAGGGTGRYSYIAADPYDLLVVPATEGIPTLDPFEAVRRRLPRIDIDGDAAPVPFLTGAVGFFGYELGRCLERLPAPHPDPGGAPEMAVGFFDTVAAFDTIARRAWVIGSGLPERSPDARRRRAEARVAALAAGLAGTPEPPDPASVPRGLWQADFDRAEHMRRVARVIEYIRAGDIFQANMTQRFRIAAPPGVAPFDLYRHLRRRSPAPFAAFLRFGEVWLASASPERFLALGPDGRVQTRPIKGTRPRRPDPAEDAREAAELCASIKDRAENLMIVDLLRNDIGRVCRTGSVRVPQLVELESFASVHHLVSVVEGVLEPGRDAVDLLRACFPGGSITGAPKIRAMEIIRELEAGRRGPYCGTIAWFGIDGAMDSSIVIRTLVGDGREIAAQAGGGIVSDSDPAAEYEEVLVKIRPLLSILGDLPE